MGRRQSNYVAIAVINRLSPAALFQWSGVYVYREYLSALYYTIYQSTSYTRAVVSKRRPFVQENVCRFGPSPLVLHFVHILCHVESDLGKPVQRESGRAHAQRTARAPGRNIGSGVRRQHECRGMKV